MRLRRRQPLTQRGGSRSRSPLVATFTGPTTDLNLGLKYFLNGALVSDIVLDTTEVATDTIDYVATDHFRGGKMRAARVCFEQWAEREAEDDEAQVSAVPSTRLGVGGSALLPFARSNHRECRHTFLRAQMARAIRHRADAWLLRRTAGTVTSDLSHQLTTRLDALIDDAAKTAVLGMGDVEREASMLRRSNSPYSAREKNAVLRGQFHKTTAEMAKTVARASHLDDAAKLTRLEAGALQLSERLAGLARTDYSEAGGPGDKHFFARVYEELRAKLDRDVASLKHDFPTGFVWGEPTAS